MTTDGEKLIWGLYESIEKNDIDALTDALHEDAVQEWPQSGERLVGRANIVGVMENYPNAESITSKPRRLSGAGDVWVAEYTLDYGDGKSVHCCSIFELRDGKIARETDYFADAFEAPEWRSKWTEKMGE